MDDLHYYKRQMILPEVGAQGQKKLSNSRCLVVGAGGLGSPALFYLAAAGIGTIGICDADRIDITNLHRQILFTTDEVGSFKADIAAKKLLKLNPFIQIYTHRERLSHINCAHIVSQYDLVLDCTDNFSTKFLLNDASFLLKVPLIRASIYRFEGQLQFYRSLPEEACLRCLWTEIPQDDCVGNCAEVGVLGPLPGTFGVLQAMEAIKFFLGLQILEKNILLLYDLISHSQQKISLEWNKECLLCGIHSKIHSLNSDIPWEIESSCLLEDYQLVDIREKEELEQLSLETLPFIHLPLSDFKETALEPCRAYLFFCRSGKRSHHLVSLLRQKGFDNAFSLRGGIQALLQNKIDS